MSLIPDISSESFTVSAVIVGLLLISDTTSNEQNAIGNWLMLVAQVLCTDAYFKGVEEERQNMNSEDTKELLKKVSKAVDKEINNFGK